MNVYHLVNLAKEMIDKTNKGKKMNTLTPICYTCFSPIPSIKINKESDCIIAFCSKKCRNVFNEKVCEMKEVERINSPSVISSNRVSINLESDSFPFAETEEDQTDPLSNTRRISSPVSQITGLSLAKFTKEINK